jgi:hypothetical protein
METPKEQEKQLIVKGRSQGITEKILGKITRPTKVVINEFLGIEAGAEKPIQTVDPEERVRQLAAAKAAADAEDKARKDAIATGKPYTNTTCFYRDKDGRLLRFWNPKTRTSKPKISLPSYTPLVIYKIKGDIAIVSAFFVPRAGKFNIHSAAITMPPPTIPAERCPECGALLSEGESRTCEICEDRLHGQEKAEVQQNDRD